MQRNETDSRERATVQWTDWSCDVQITLERQAAIFGARALAMDIMARVGRAIDRFDPNSELSKLNRRAGLMTPVSSLCEEIVDAAVDAAKLTNGACDPTVGVHLAAVGYDRDIDEVRFGDASGDRRPPASSRPDWRRVRRNSAWHLIGVPAGCALDLGATAKAWTAQRCAREINAAFDTAVLVSIGGDIATAGSPRRPWRVAVSERGDAPEQLVSLERGSIATSTTTLRHWTHGGRTVHHIMDPRTGRPSNGRWRTASVWATDAVRANAMSTAVIACAEDAESLLTLTQTAARLVDTNGQVRLFGGWPSDGADIETNGRVVA
jgi:thiamine biosynthesis lipoprotein